tara:strand:+ start:213 stop:374 length:162 start_codon:yes stop_codon:yes gene_type:complete
MRKRIDPVARAMAFNRRQTSTRVVQDKRKSDKDKQAKEEIRDARYGKYDKDQG